MPRFPVAFGRRKSTADNLENVPVEPSFRVLDRSEVSIPGGGKSFDGGARLAAARTHTLPNLPNPKRLDLEDNIFADLKPNRGSGSSNTTKTTSTDNSSRHSNASTTPSSADLAGQEEWRNTQRRYPNDIPIPPIPKTSSNGFLKAAGRTFSFGGQKKHLPPVPAARESPPPSPPTVTRPEPHQTPLGRSRATTTSTSTTLTPPRLDSEFDLDLGGDFGRMLLGSEKRASMMTLKEDPNSRNALAPRSLTGNRLNQNQPSPIQIDKTANVEASPYSWSSHRSDDQLLTSTSPAPSPPIKENAPPPVPRHNSPLASRDSRLSASPELVARKPLVAPPAQPSDTEQAEGEDEEARLLKDSLSTVTRFMSGGKSKSGASSGLGSGSRYRRNEDAFDSKGDDESLFDTSHAYPFKSASRFTARKPSPQQSHKVMTPAEFEKYRKDKERQDKERQQDTFSDRTKATDDDDEDNYEDDDDDLEKAKQQAKQRRKQEAHMAVYRQQMMKVTGEAAGETPSRPSLQISFSTPHLPHLSPGQGPSPVGNTSENSDEDEEVPLAILAAHGFPGKNRPPTRLSTMMSNPNLRASQQPSYQRPMSAVGDAPPAGNPRLPAFARNLPQDPFIGAGLVRNSTRESFALGGGSPTPGQMAPAPPGGLIGVIANEERSRAMRRGSPLLDGSSAMPGGAGFDPVAGIPPQMMYPNNPNRGTLTPGDQAQIQMTQQMQQFMQMQMQFMQMMAGQNGNALAGPSGNPAATQSMANLGRMNGMNGMMPGMGGPGSMLGLPGMPGMSMGGPDMMRHSFVGGNDSSLDLSARPDSQMRTMSMIQPSSASWIQQPQSMGSMGFAPSIHIQGAGYAPSIAPSERSNVGLPGRYRPVSQAPPPHPTAPGHLRSSSTMSGAVQSTHPLSKSGNTSDDDDEEGWEAMKAKREKKKSMWKSKKTLGEDLSAYIS